MRLAAIPNHRRLAILLALAAAACSHHKRVVLVAGADQERILAVAANDKVRDVLGEDGASAFLDGHVIRPGEQMVLVVREWDPASGLPFRRITLVFERRDEVDLELPSASASVHASRARGDGAAVRELVVAEGSLRVRRVSLQLWDVEMVLRFADPNEPPEWTKRTFGECCFDDATTSEGRSNPFATPEEFLRIVPVPRPPRALRPISPPAPASAPAKSAPIQP